MHLILKVSGISLMLSGGLWAFQGLGLVTWPADSFMLSEGRWVAIGSATLLLGISLFIMGRRKA